MKYDPNSKTIEFQNEAEKEAFAREYKNQYGQAWGSYDKEKGNAQDYVDDLQEYAHKRKISKANPNRGKTRSVKQNMERVISLDVAAQKRIVFRGQVRIFYLGAFMFLPVALGAIFRGVCGYTDDENYTYRAHLPLRNMFVHLWLIAALAAVLFVLGAVWGTWNMDDSDKCLRKIGELGRPFAKGLWMTATRFIPCLWLYVKITNRISWLPRMLTIEKLFNYDEARLALERAGLRRETGIHLTPHFTEKEKEYYRNIRETMAKDAEYKDNDLWNGYDSQMKDILK